MLPVSICALELTCGTALHTQIPSCESCSLRRAVTPKFIGDTNTFALITVQKGTHQECKGTGTSEQLQTESFWSPSGTQS